MRISSIAGALAGLLLPLTASAQSKDRALAETLFTDAKRLMEAGKLDEACPKFDDSYRAFPGTGTLINAAACYEKAGRTATAWARYGEAGGAAQRDGNQERLTYVNERKAALEPRLTRVKLEVAEDLRTTPGLEVKVNARAIPTSAFGLGVPVDPGKVSVDATAPERGSFHQELEAGEAQQYTVKIDQLLVSKGRAPSASNAPAANGSVTADEPGSSSNTQKTLGYVIGGVVGVGLGVAFNLMARSAAEQADEDCVDSQSSSAPCIVSSTSQRTAREESLSDAESKATISYVGLGVGAAALATGVVLLVTAGNGEGPRQGARIAPIVSHNTLGLSFGGSL